MAASTRPARRRTRPGLLAAGVVVALLAVALVWLVVRGLAARRDLVDAYDGTPVFRGDLLAGQLAAADVQLAAVRVEAGAARRLTGDPVWRAAAALPWVGRPFAATRGVALAADDLAVRVLPGLAEAADLLAPARLRVTGDTFAVDRLRRALPALSRAEGALRAVAARLTALPAVAFPGQVEHGRRALLAAVASFEGTVADASAFARIGPGLLGADGPRRYFVAVQNNAESRGTGGLVGAFLILDADHGRVHVERVGSDRELRPAARPVAHLGAAYEHAYGADAPTTSWSGSNVSANFPDAARIWAGLWAAQSGERVDGAIAVDPVALSYLLAVTGPIGATGAIGADNVVSVVESEIYALAPDQALRKQLLAGIARRAAAAVLSGRGNALDLVRALARAAGEHHLALWSSRASEEAVLAATPLGGALPVTTQPYAGLVVNNIAGNKLDYWLRRTVFYSGGGCAGTHRETVVSIRLTNAAPTGLPAYVTLRTDDPSHPHPPGSTRIRVSLYATAGARLLGVTLDGVPTTLSVAAEAGHPLFSTLVALARGQTRALLVRLLEPVAAGPPLVPVQPLAAPQLSAVTLPTCG